MREVLKVVSGISAVVGGLILYAAVSTSDYHAMMGLPEPEWINWSIGISIMLFAPLSIMSIYKSQKRP